MKSIATILLLMLAVPGIAVAQKAPATTPKPTSDQGGARAPRKAAPISGRIAPGDMAPTFELDASNGKPIKLTSLRGSWLVLVFADRWQQVQPLDVIQDDVRQLNARVVGLCHEKAHTLVGAATRQKMPVMVLADVTGEISAMYGLFEYGRSETQPGCLVIDPKGEVQFALLGQLPPAETVGRIVRFVITGE
jgi:peroxiredoxin